MSSLEFCAVMRAADAPDLPARQIVRAAGLAAIYMEAPGGRHLSTLFRAARRGVGTALRRAQADALLVRQRALEVLHASGDVLPALPGARLGVADAAATLIANRTALEEALAALSGRAQRQVTVFWDLARVDERFADAPEHAPGGGGSAALTERIATVIEGLLRGASQDAITLPLSGDEMLVNVVCLGARDDPPAFEAALEAADAIWSEGLRIKVVGPSPAISFAALGLRRLHDREIAAAMRALDLPWMGAAMAPPAAQIDAAFRTRAMAAHDVARQAPGDMGALQTARHLLHRVGEAQSALIRAGAWTAGTALPPLALVRRDGGTLPAAPRSADRAA